VLSHIAAGGAIDRSHEHGYELKERQTMNKFEYKYLIHVKEKELEKTANLWAAEGWRIVLMQDWFRTGTTMGLPNLLLERPVE
jgi:hypothetical protein